LELIPAVDIIKGKCVRLYQGRAETAKVYYSNPITAAEKFSTEGAKLIHIVDLDAAMGVGENSEIILEMAKKIDAKLEVGGGIRDRKIAEKYLDNGIERVVMGTAVFINPDIVKQIADSYGKQRIVAAIDHFKGEVKIKGWLESTNKDLSYFIKFVEDLDVGFILLSSIEGDGTLKGPDLVTAEKAIKSTRIPIILAGGIGSLDDIIKLKNLNPYGVIVGRALYENKFSFKDAVNVVYGGQ